ncbi:hypothetical protein JCM3765_001674 [Sporobolomyces pararoseus]
MEQDLENNSSVTPQASTTLEKKHSDLELAWSDIVYVAPKRQQPILNNVTGSARSGQLLAGELSPPPLSFSMVNRSTTNNNK